MFSKGGFCRVQGHAQGTKNTRGYWAQHIRHCERHSQERRTFLHKPPSKKPLSRFLKVAQKQLQSRFWAKSQE